MNEEFEMNARERFYAITHYQDRDRLFLWEMGPYEETLKRWRSEGMRDASDKGWEHLGGCERLEHVPVPVGLHPGFEYETLEDMEDYEIYRDSDGVIKKKIKNLPPPAMPQYLEYLLKGRKEWPQFKKRLNPDDADRFPSYWDTIRKLYAKCDFPVGINCGSLYGWLRNWMGVEDISLAVYDDPAFLEEASTDIADCILAVLEKALEGIQYDFALLWEDMAYKTSSLINPQHYRKIFLPQYRRITERLHKAGIDIIMLDSDGNVEELIPCWLDIGINFIYPMEVAAGMDVVVLRKKFGKELLIGGGMDKRVLASDKSAIKKMVEEKVPLLREGGYIPTCDHAIPPDVSWENYLYYRELLLDVKP